MRRRCRLSYRVFAAPAGVVAISLFAACGGSHQTGVSTPTAGRTAVLTATAATAAPSCVTTLNVVVSDARFVAFDGALRPHAGGKLLIVLLHVPGPGPDAVPVTSDKFTLEDAQHNVYQATPDPAIVPPSQVADATALRMAFDVPRSLGTGRLVYQAGCSQSWDVP